MPDVDWVDFIRLTCAEIGSHASANKVYQAVLTNSPGSLTNA